MAAIDTARTKQMAAQGLAESAKKTLGTPPIGTPTSYASGVSP